ncbi:hypothetical protein ColTof4_12206 [Colletotrichum tofieldiae]|nr:hypothetical protein ColTof3_05618 [Colletotrichum tofieldiae]GKT79783.1 hypothetical protein ColTof4_12206 [Colletotrichum tofieldiae]
MPILKATARAAASIRVERVVKEKKGSLRPSGAGVKKLLPKNTTGSNNSNTTMSSAKSSSGISASFPLPSGSKTAKALRIKRAPKAIKQTKTTITPYTSRRAKKLISAASLSGLVPISSFGSRASTMRASLAPPPQEDSSKPESRSRQPPLGPQ